MNCFGPGKAALHFRKKKKAKVAADDEEPDRYRLEEGDGTSHAQRIVRELYFRYEKQLQRWKDYRNLFFFLGFVALFLAVLYEQRQSSVSFEVYSTIDAVVTPTNDVMQDNQGIYSWLQKLLTEVWQDPICGDGLCEAPFEFASYSRFGCRADCGKLSDVQNLTKIQVDLYWDFSHPVGSIPASDLMRQASWNLCPNKVDYAPDCYYDKDQTFDRLASSLQVLIDDAPDGDWDLLVRQDIFSKIRGAVRDTTLVYAAAYYYKIYVAAASVLEEQEFERWLLNRAVEAVDLGFIGYADRFINASYPNASEYNFNRTQVLHAPLLCGGKFNGTTGNENATTEWFNTLLAGFPDPTKGNNMNDAANFLGAAGNLSGIDYASKFIAANQLWFYTDANYTVRGAAGVAYTNTSVHKWQAITDANNTWLGRRAVNIITTNATDLNNWCRDANQLLSNWANNYTQSVRAFLIDTRMGNQRDTGKIVQRTTATNRLRNYMIVNMPELVSPIFDVPKGTVALEDPVRAQLSSLQQLYLDSLKYQTEVQRAAFNMTRRVVYATNYTMVDLRARALARLAELADQKASTRGIVIRSPMDKPYQNQTFPNTTVGEIMDVFAAAGATAGMTPGGVLSNAFLPDASNMTLGIFRYKYDLVSWAGNTTAYMRCDLRNRGKEYLGTCVAMTVSCIPTVIDTAPYICNTYSDNATVPGNLSVTAYRTNCEIPCDRRADCNTICECYGSCGTQEYCECRACTEACTSSTECTPINNNAAYDLQFQSITSTSLAAEVNAVIADVGAQAGGRRRLAQTQSVEQQLSSVLTTLGTVTNQQTAITSQMSTLRAQVDLANQLAQARANDNRLIDLISAGRADIQAGQARVEAKLDVIIGKQNQALEAANKALTALSNIQSLADKQLNAQRALETAVNTQLSAIRVATTTKVISLTQALALWKRARRDRLLTFKAATLANIPCNTAPYADNDFKLDNGNIVDNSTARERNVGLTNRVIGGLLLHQTRTNETLCPQSKFDKIQKTCTGPGTVASFGVDPVFKRGTTSYDADFDDKDGVQVVTFYNCSMLAKPTYNVTFLNQTVNQRPYCAELFNPQGTPYGFHFFPLEGKSDGFPVWYDINLSQEQAQKWFTWMQEGLYLDQNTRVVTAEMVTYNAPLRIFSYHRTTFTYNDGGSIKVTHRQNAVQVELYKTDQEKVVYGFTILLSAWIYGMMLWQLCEIAWTQKTQGNFLKYFSRGWHWLLFLSNGLLAACMSLWWVYVTTYAKDFDIKLRYNVYADLGSYANYLALADKNGAGLIAGNADINKMRELNDFLNWYFALNGINILLLIARVLKLMDFQPRLGVVTRSLWLAGPDLIHFAIVAGMVFIGYSMMAHLIFGNAIEQFASFGDAVNTCFEILLGNIDVNTELRNLPGLQAVAGALFFWTYELLVFMVLLNFLLAIIVDAFSEVKEKTNETVGIHTELFMLMRDKFRGMLGRCSPNYISDKKLGTLLKQWAGEEDKEAASAARMAQLEQAEKLITVLNEDLDEDTLKNVLVECMRDAPGDAADKEKKAGFLARIFNRRSNVEASPEDIALAAHYIIDRFGAKPTVEELQEEEATRRAGEGAPQEQQNVLVGGMGPGAGAPTMAPQGMAMGGMQMQMLGGGPVLEKERDQLAAALERLADVQRELADGQRNLMAGQKQLADQQSKLVQLMNEQGPGV